MMNPLVLTLLVAAAPGEPPVAATKLAPSAAKARLQAERKVRLPMPASPRPALPEETLTPVGRPLEARIEGWMDGAVRVSKPLSPAQEKLLRRRGVPVVQKADEIGDEAIFEGRLFVFYRVAPDLGGPAGEVLFGRLQGRTARLVIARSSRDAHLEIVEARSAD